MDRPCDDVTADPVVGAFAYYGVDVALRDDGQVVTNMAGLARIATARGIAAMLRSKLRIAAGSNETLNADEYVSTMSERSLDALFGTGTAPTELVEAITASEALIALVALDLAARLDSLHEASDPDEELRFLVAAADSGSYGDLGPHVAAAAETLTASC